MGTQLADKTLGIVGLGRIGQAVASRAKALQMRVLGYDPFLSSERISELGFEPVPSVAAMLGEIDYLTVHTPLTDETRNLIGKPELEKLKPGVRLINCARGGIYDESGAGRGIARAASWAAWRSTCSPASRAPTARCSACPTCWPRPTWARAPKRRRRKWPSKAWGCWSIFSPPAPSATRST